MLKIQFTNAQVSDDGYGLCVNGKELEKIISTALGTRVDHVYGFDSGLPRFKSDCCNVTVIIDPLPITETIETPEGLWHSVKELEGCKREQYREKDNTQES